MARKVVECVPNFSEGRDLSVVERIAGAISSIPGAAVLGQTSDYDHNRSVITFAGDPESIAEAAFRGIEQAVALIDLTRHGGVHPRIGAADVVPFVPISGVSMADCVRIAERVGERVWRELKVPVYLYESAARHPDRVNLANIRRGRFEGQPDLGDPSLHPTGGACVIGARKFLIAFNINLATTNVEIARAIARKIRFSSGGLPAVKALGLFLESRRQAQVSINLTNFEETTLCAAFEAVEAEARRHGAAISGTELIGLIPRKALETAAPCNLRFENFHPGLVLENRLEQLL